jgi:hypothetical protein
VSTLIFELLCFLARFPFLRFPLGRFPNSTSQKAWFNLPT